MNSKLFRKESIDQINSPEAFDETVQAVRPKVWLLVAVLGLFCLALLIWGFGGTVKTTLSTTGYIKDKTIVCLLPPVSGLKITQGMSVEIDGNPIGEVETVNPDPIKKEDLKTVITSDYYMNALVSSNYVIVVRIATARGDYDTRGDGLVNLNIVMKTFRPIDFLFNSEATS